MSDRQMGKVAKQELTEAPATIERSHLPGKHKVWCYQHTQYQRVIWPLKVWDFPCRSQRDGQLAKQLHVVGLAPLLFGLPINPISLEYKQEKACLVLELKDSADPLIKSVKVPICTGHKWRVQAELDGAISSLQHWEVMRSVLVCRARLGCSKTMLVDEVTRLEQEHFNIEAISHSSQLPVKRSL